MSVEPRGQRRAEVVVVGGGQAGLATAYHLRRIGLVPGEDVVVLDAADRPGGAWPRMWEGLRLFSPSSYSSLPGWMMPAWNDAEHGFPPRDHVVDYLTRYEERYDLQVLRPHRVTAVRAADDPGDRLLVEAPDLEVSTRYVVSATGTWDQPFWPTYPGAGAFVGRQLHAAQYGSPADLAGARVVVVGGGNSAAQLLAEISEVAAATTWVTLRPPRFLPDDVDGRVLFDVASSRIHAEAAGQAHDGVGGLGDIVMVPSVRAARERGALESRPVFERLTATGVAWADGTVLACDVIVWCTGFRPALRHLAPLRLRDHEGRVPVGGASGTRAERDHRVHLVGYGDWVGPASATLIGVGRTARATAREVLSAASTSR